MTFYKTKDIAELCNVKTTATITKKIHEAVDNGILKNHVLLTTPLMLNEHDLEIFLVKYYPYVYDTYKDNIFSSGSQQERSNNALTTVNLSNGTVQKQANKGYYLIRDFELVRTPNGDIIKYKNKEHFKTRKEAQRKRNELIKRRSAGEFLQLATEAVRHKKNKPLLFVDFLENLIANKEYCEKSRLEDNKVLRNHIKPFFKNTLVSELNMSLLCDFAESLKGKGNLGRIKSLINSGVKALTRRELIPNINTDCLPYPKDEGKGTKPKPALTREELNVFLGYYKGHRLEHAMHLFFNTGVRPQEMQALTWDDLYYNPDNSIMVTINKAWGLTEVGYGVKETKNKSSNRTIYIPPNEYLVKLLQTAQSNSKGCKYVLANSKYTAPIEGNNLTKRYFKAVAQEVGIKKNVTAHVARHTYTSLCLAQGINPIDLIKQTGHNDTTMITKVYGHSITSIQDAFKTVTLTPNNSPLQSPIHDMDKVQIPAIVS